MTRRTALALALTPALPALADGPKMTIYKTPTCGCCGKWVEQLRAAGFDLTVNDVPNTGPYRQKFGIPETLASCHSGQVGAYSIEGHVPISDIQRLLKTGMKGKGLAVPGMPATAPGMDAPHGAGYSVILFQANGETTVFHEYPAK